MTVHTIRFEGPAALAVRVATALADADGVDLTSSATPAVLDADTVELSLTAEGTQDDIAGAVADIKAGLPRGASIEIIGE